MANSVYDDKVPGETGLGDNQNTPLGDPSDPRGADTIAAGKSSDPRGPDNMPADKTSDPRGELKNAEQGDGLFNPSGDSSKNSALSTGRLAAIEAAGGPAGAALKAGKQLSLARRGKRRGLISAGTVTIVIVTALAGLGVLSGPAHEIQDAEILKRSFANTEQASSNRNNNLLRYATARDMGETRLGFLGKKYFRPKVAALEKMGVTFKTNALGGLRSTEIDTNKLAQEYPELKNMSPSERQAWLADRYDGLPLDSVQSRGGGEYLIDGTDFSMESTSLLREGSISFLSDGKAQTALNNRVFKTYFDQPSLFSYFKKATEKLHQSANAAQRDAEDKAEQERQAQLTEPTEAKGAAAVEDVKGNADRYNSVAMKSLLFTGGACFLRSSANGIVDAGKYRVELPAVIRALNFISVGEQIKKGKNISMDQLGAFDRSYNNNNESIDQAKAMQVLAGAKNPSGDDLPEEYKQIFSGKVKAKTIKGWADTSLGGSVPAGALCSTVGQAAQGLLSIGAAAVSLVAEVGSGGTLTPAIVGTWAAKEGASFAASAVAMHFAEKFIVSSGAPGALAKNAFSGKLGGNLLAWGAMKGATIGAAAEGGIPMSSADVATYTQENQQQEVAQFQSQPLFARLFDTHESRSMISKLAVSVSPSLSQNLGHIAASIPHIGSLVASSFSWMLPHSNAATQYDWGFSMIGIPQSMLKDPSLADPYENGKQLKIAFDGAGDKSFVDRADKCFHAKIDESGGVLDATFSSTDPVDQNSDEYEAGDCGNLSDPTWKRTVMFVFDTHNMKAEACYEGDGQSCADIGADDTSTNTTDTTTTDTTTDASTSLDMAHLDENSTSIACASGTKDLGVQDGYTGGQKVKIRVCGVDSVPETGDLSDVSGADGKLVVNSRLSAFYVKLVEDAKAAGVTSISAQEGFRSMARQTCLYEHRCGPVTTVAAPGTSNHQMGLAVDWSDSMITYLSREPHGLKALVSGEPWHWSPTGN